MLKCNGNKVGFSNTLTIIIIFMVNPRLSSAVILLRENRNSNHRQFSQKRNGEIYCVYVVVCYGNSLAVIVVN